MTVTHPIRTDLVRRGVTPRVYAMQYDANTRVVALTLTAEGAPWTPPEDAAFALSYRKPDGTKGFYNQLSPGVSAVSLSENTVSVTLAPQVLTCAGVVEAALVLSWDGTRMAAFPFEIHVAAEPAGGTEASDDFFQVGGGGSGYTPIKGVDYFTEEDKAELLEALMVRLGHGHAAYVRADSQNILRAAVDYIPTAAVTLE